MDIVPCEYARRMAEGDKLAFLTPQESAQLLQRGHLTRLTPRQELEAFRKQARSILSRQGKTTTRRRGTLSFILTYDCNLSCSYCYQQSLREKSNPSGMSEEFLDSLFSRDLADLFPGVPKKNILFLLFGGEPLLPSNREAISKILVYARKHSIRISTATNATTISAMADLIGPGMISNVQVTLDGDQLFHDSQRIPSSGHPTFAAMVAAIHALIKRKAYIFLRIHTHPCRLDSTRRLVQYLENEKILGDPNVDVYFAPINTFDIEKDSEENKEAFFELFQRVAAKTGRPPSLNLDFLNDILKMKTHRVLPKIQFCSLGRDSLRIVDAFGDIYDCFEEAGHLDRRIGTLAHGKPEYFPLLKKYKQRHILNIPECLSCPMALFCGGGCARQAIVQKGSIFEPYCLQNKEFIAQTLRAYYLAGCRKKSPTPFC